ncbi:MFS transporter [Salinirubellus salinus]|uniref:MFS transporter n=1 Tax=Salinirubellus salinus TaxID=1364945 RepID=A0A9E7R4J0_9EURY|nr:MFS transporter [Salinirubellus salinus]UWM55346.1 MFS transporter [Salinirubellus salinus]
MNRNDRAITGLVMLAHAMVHTYELSLPLLLLVWATEFPTVSVPLVGSFETTAFVLGAVLTAGYAPFGLGALPGGVLADAYGSKRLIVACLVGMGVSFVGLALSPNLLGVAFALLVWGVAASVYHPSGLALISKGVDERGSAFAYHGMAGNLGIALGPLFTAILLFLTGDWRVVVAVLGVPALVGALAASRISVDETAAVAAADGGTEDADAGKSAKADGSITSLSQFLADSRTMFASLFVFAFGVAMFSGLYYRGVLTFLPDLLSSFDQLQPIQVAGYPRELQPDQYFYSGLLMVGVLGQYVGGKLTDRIPVSLGLVGGYGTLAVLALVFLPVATSGLVGLLVIGALLGFFLFMVQPFYQATIAESTPPEARGLSYGYTYLGVFGIGALGGTVAGGVLTYANETALFLVLAGFGAAASLLGVVLYKRR